MGDEADYYTENAENAWLMHLSGECGSWEPCQYCYEEQKEIDKQDDERNQRTKKLS